MNEITGVPYDPRRIDPAPELAPEPVLALPYLGPVESANRGTYGRIVVTREAFTRGRWDVNHAWFADPWHYYYTSDDVTVPIFRRNGAVKDVRVRLQWSSGYEPGGPSVRQETDRYTRLRRMESRRTARPTGHYQAAESDGTWTWATRPYRRMRVDSLGTVQFLRPQSDYARTPGIPEDWDGFDDAGYTSAGFDRAGFNRDGRDRDGYDSGGYDAEGYNRDGLSREGGHRRNCACDECDIQPYHKIPRDWALPSDWSDRILFGLENELDTRDKAARKRVAKLLPRRGAHDLFLIAERDGSLGDNGVETIGPPLPLESYLSNRVEHETNPWLKYLSEIVAQCGAYAPREGYGMHINISRQPLLDGPDGWDRRFLDTVNNCTRLVEHVAGRRANQWARFVNGDDRYEVNGVKYRVANVKDNVIEIRIFRATTDMTRVRANVQFCYALLQWTRRDNVARGVDCDTRLIAWIRRHPRKYQDLLPILGEYERDTLGIEPLPASPVAPRPERIPRPGSYGCGDPACESCQRDWNSLSIDRQREHLITWSE